MSMTLSQIRTQVRRDLSMDEEQFISDAEINKYINDGIDVAEAEIHTLYEDYFLDYLSLPLSVGVDTYDLPSNIYANKIRKVIYDNGSDKEYLIARIKKLEDTMSSENENSDYYKYLITNVAPSTVGTAVTAYTVGTKLVVFSADHKLPVGSKVEFFTSGGVTRGTDYVASTPSSTSIILSTGIAAVVPTDTCTRLGGIKIKLFPTSAENSTSAVTLWYIRNSKTLSLDADVCDIPEFVSYVIWYTKAQCVAKDVGNPMTQYILSEVEKAKTLMVETLTSMVPDDDNFIGADLSFYSDFNTEMMD